MEAVQTDSLEGPLTVRGIIASTLSQWENLLELCAPRLETPLCYLNEVCIHALPLCHVPWRSREEMGSPFVCLPWKAGQECFYGIP